MSVSIPLPSATVPPVSLQRLAAVYAVIAEAAVVAFPSEEWYLAFGLMVLSLGSILAASRRTLVDASFFWQVVAIIVLYVIKYTAFFDEYPFETSYINSEMTRDIAYGLITTQIVMLYQARYAARLPATFAVLGGMAAVFGSNARIYGIRLGRISLILTLLVLLGLALFAMTSRRPRPQVRGERRKVSVARLLLTAAVFSTFVIAASAGSLTLRRYERDLESLVLSYLAGKDGEGAHRTGYEHSGTLSQVSNWKTEDDERIRLRVESDVPPGYLRGSVFTSYAPYAGRWSNGQGTQSVGIGGPRNAGRPAFPGNFFRLAPIEAPLWRQMVFRADADNIATTFLPLETAYLYINEPNLSMDESRAILRRPATADKGPYAALLPLERPREVPTDSQRDAALELVVPLDPRVRDLADEIFAGSRSVREKVNAVMAYFHRNHQYQLGIDIPPDEEPIVHFLTTKAAAHCEYFAAATALLLKHAGVPARYVTGYVAVERNELGGLWLARSKDAHAWVEAYDDEEGRWVIVESTPSSGVPARRGSGIASELSIGLTQALQTLWARLQDPGLPALLLDLLQKPVVQALAAGGVLVLLIWLGRRRPRNEAGPALLHDLRSWHRLLHRMDRRMKRAGLPRRPEEPPLTFAERIEATWSGTTTKETTGDGETRPVGATGAVASHPAATWYRTYAAARYAPERSAPPPDVTATPAVTPPAAAPSVLSPAVPDS